MEEAIVSDTGEGGGRGGDLVSSPCRKTASEASVRNRGFLRSDEDSVPRSDPPNGRSDSF